MSSSAEKRLLKMKQNPKGWRYDEVADTLRAFGFQPPRRPKGSHRTFRHPGCGLRITLVEHGSRTLLPVYVEKAVEKIEQVRKCKNVGN